MSWSGKTVEKVARGLCKYDGLNPDAGSALTDAENWYNYVNLAKAALAIHGGQ